MVRVTFRLFRAKGLSWLHAVRVLADQEHVLSLWNSASHFSSSSWAGFAQFSSCSSAA